MFVESDNEPWDLLSLSAVGFIIQYNISDIKEKYSIVFGKHAYYKIIISIVIWKNGLIFSIFMYFHT